MKRLLAACLLSSVAVAAPLPNFVPAEPFHEQALEQTLPDGVLAYTNAGADYDPARPTKLILYLLPNGNTIPQTLGRQLAAGDDWHYDIQHIAAQTRLLRHLDPAENVVLVLLQAPGKSWPKFRADHKADNPQLIRALVEGVEKPFASPAGKLPNLDIVSHSGGGSFVFGYLNSSDPIAANVDRIAFLDSNYSYDDADHHGEKLQAWLRSSPDKHLIVFCYDDRNVVLGGKKIVSDTGGTYRATQRMIDFFSKGEPATTDTAGPFAHVSLLGGQAQFFRHPNPELKILHTAMIGEMNIFLEAVTIDTDAHAKYGTLGGPRAYSQYVTPAPATQPATRPRLKLPPRRASALTGSAILAAVKDLSANEREAFVEREVRAGNVPPSLRTLVPITVTAAGADAQHTATYYVTPDVLSLGTDADAFRMPLTPNAAQRIATALDCSLITRKISNDIYANAAIKLEPRPLTEKREAATTLYQHHQIIEEQLKQLPSYTPGLLIAGHKKDIVLTPRLADKPGKVAIYGWHKLDGKPIQPLYLGHADYYVDYSHGIRLMSNHLVVDGHPATVQQVLADPNLAPLLSDEGVLTVVYPATRATTRP